MSVVFVFFKQSYSGQMQYTLYKRRSLKQGTHTHQTRSATELTQNYLCTRLRCFPQGKLTGLNLVQILQYNICTKFNMSVFVWIFKTIKSVYNLYTDFIVLNIQTNTDKNRQTNTQTVTDTQTYLFQLHQEVMIHIVLQQVQP